MDKHCKGCSHHHKAGHPQGSRLGKSRYNDWCCKYGQHAKPVVGKCKMEGSKKVAIHWIPLPPPPTQQEKPDNQPGDKPTKP